MPVFHTKTIESILEPVSQQVSKLVVLQEEAENGNEMPDLSMPVQAVKVAADNLIKVAFETIDTSNDLIFKQEMPIALNRVQDACNSLRSATDMLKYDPKSPNAKICLIDGERGILQGVSAILLTFDESEVRKIVAICKQVLDYLLITEVIERMDDLVTYVKNLTPILTKMAREVDAREKELTHQIHRDLLNQNLNEVKALAPALISSIKTYLMIKQQQIHESKANGSSQAQQNREYIIRSMCEKVQEIIRILQLTTYDEDEWLNDDLTIMKQRLNNFEDCLKHASDWLLDPNAVVNGIGEKAFKSALDDAYLIASKIEDKTQSSYVTAECDKLNGLLSGMHKYIAEGKRNTASAMQLGALMNDHFVHLYETFKAIVNNAQSVQRTDPTIFGKVEQASKWCMDPFYNDRGLGENAARLIIEEAKKIAANHKDPRVSESFMRTAHESEIFVNKLAQLQHAKQNGIEALAIGKQLQERLNSLGHKITYALVQQFADDYIDVNFPLKKLAEVASSPFETPNREAIFKNSAKLFQMHTEKLCETAKQIANSTPQACNKRTIENINQLAKSNNNLAPQVINAAIILFSQPANKSYAEHFEILQKQWFDDVERMRRLVDANVDPALFIRACEYSILKDTQKAEMAVQDQNSFEIVTNASNIARRANRIIQVAAQEIENSEDATYVAEITNASEALKTTVPSMIHKAKALATNPTDNFAYDNWSDANQKIIEKVAQVREAVSYDTHSNDASFTSTASNLPNLDSLNINAIPTRAELVSAPSIKCFIARSYKPNLSKETNEQIPPERPPLPKNIYPERPPSLPAESEDEIESVDFPVPESNQPILMAAHDLHVNLDQWSSRDNDLVAVAKRITLLMAKLSELVRGEGGNKKDLIATSKQLADESQEITRLAKVLARDCTDKRMKNNLLQVCERIPTIGTQLKILSTVKATMLGAQGSKEDEEATEMLICNAQNLNASVKETVQAAKSASIRIRADSGVRLKWVRKRPSQRSTHRNSFF